MTIPNAITPEIHRWIAATSGGEIVSAKRLPGGNRREAVAVDVSVNGQLQELFLRYDPVDPKLSGDYFTISRESTFYSALKGTGVSIPAIIGVHPQLQAMLTERVRGRSAYAKIADVEEKTRISLDFMRHLARLHALDVELITSRFPDAKKSIAELIAAEIDTWNGLYRQTGTQDPLIEFGLVWLRQHLPHVDEPASVVHGDAGPGNFLFESGAVTALLDWELAHLGDPIEDLAWLSMRTVLEPFPDFARCLQEYEGAVHRRVDRDRLRYHRVFVQWRIAIIRHRNAGEDAANSLISRTLNRRLLVEAIVAASNQPAQEYTRVRAPDGPHDAFYGAALDSLRNIIAPTISDPYVMGKAKSVARIVKYLQQCATLGPAIATAESDDLARILGHAISSIDAAQAELAERIQSGRIHYAILLAYFAQHVGRDTQLMENGLGALAWRPFPSIEDKQ